MSDNTVKFLEYKGYKGSIEIDTEDEILYGHVQNLNNPKDIVSYEGETLKALKHDFEAAIDNYLEVLKQENSKQN